MRSRLPAILACLLLCPFLLAFAPPQDGGTYVSASAGLGRFAYTPSGCGNPRPRMVEFANQQVGVYHRWEPKRAGWWPEMGLGLDVNAFVSREKECTEEDCANPEPGWTRNSVRFALSPYGTLEWKWVGLTMKGHLPWEVLRGDDRPADSEAWLVLPIGYAVRVGRLDRFYATLSVQDEQPVKSGGQFLAGLGTRVFGTDLWAGYGSLSSGGAFGMRLARTLGPVRLRLGGGYGRSSIDYSDSDEFGVTEEFRVATPDYFASAGLDYRLPW